MQGTCQLSRLDALPDIRGEQEHNGGGRQGGWSQSIKPQ